MRQRAWRARPAERTLFTDRLRLRGVATLHHRRSRGRLASGQRDRRSNSIELDSLAMRNYHLRRPQRHSLCRSVRGRVLGFTSSPANAGTFLPSFTLP